MSERLTLPAFRGRDIPPPPPGFHFEGSRRAPAQGRADAADAAAANAVEPSEAQKQANNYKQGHLRWNGLSISIETPKGRTRSGTSEKGERWEVEMPAHYGSIKGTRAADGDQVDVYVGDDLDSPKVFIVDQVDAKTGDYDEAKVIIGASDRHEAEGIYRDAFSDGRSNDRRGAMTEMSVKELRRWLREENTAMPYSDDVEHADRRPAPSRPPEGFRLVNPR